MTTLKKWTFHVGVNGRSSIPVTTIADNLQEAGDKAAAIGRQIWPDGVGHTGSLSTVEEILDSRVFNVRQVFSGE